MVRRKWGAIPRVRILPHLSDFNDGPVLAEIKGELSNYYVSIEFDKTGKMWFKSGQATDKSSARNIIKTKIEEGSAYLLTHNTQGRTGLDTSSIHMNTVAEILKRVNNERRRNLLPTCMAWTLTSLTRKRPLPVPGTWYMAGLHC